MPSESTVVIAPPDLLPRLVDRLRSQEGGDLTSCPDTDIAAAIERVLEIKPDRVALERLFAATSRGAALLSRLKADPALAHAEFRIVSHDSDYWRVSPRRPAPSDAMPPAVPQPVTSDAPPLDQHGTRRAARVWIQDGVEVLVDGSPARLVDLSAVGGQVLSSAVLKPNQRVRVSMVDGRVTLRCQATIIWARFELSHGEPGARYRAGLEFSGADTDGVAEYARRHQKKN
ncbi:MAG: PilZ domain-containing protein [Vicinamibacteria bacterium]|nr:PilZ domain-containing protein [Vicinamibacteria bacterium]